MRVNRVVHERRTVAVRREKWLSRATLAVFSNVWESSPGTAETRVPNSQSEKDKLMKPLRHWIVDFLKREDGPTAVEYAVMLSLIIVVCLASISVLGSNASSKFSEVAATIAPAAAS